MYGVGCEIVYGIGGVESFMGWGARSCMDQMVSNRVWGGVRGRVWSRWCQIVYMSEMRGRVWNRWCRIVYGVGSEVMYGPDGVESCMGWAARSCMEQVVANHVWG